MAVSERASQHAARPSARPSARRQRQERRRRHVCVCARVAQRGVPSLSRQQAQPPWLPSAGARCELLPGVLRVSPLPASKAVIRHRSSSARQRGYATTACTRARTDSSSGLGYPAGKRPFAAYSGSGSPCCWRSTERLCRCSAHTNAVSARSQLLRRATASARQAAHL